MKRRKEPGPQGGRRTTEAIEATGARTNKLPQVRVSDEEREFVEALARQHGASLADWIRRRALTTGATK